MNKYLREEKLKNQIVSERFRTYQTETMQLKKDFIKEQMIYKSIPRAKGFPDAKNVLAN